VYLFLFLLQHITNTFKVDKGDGGVSVDLSSPSQRTSWALTSRPDRGHPTLHAWWAPVALRYKERWGASGSQYEVHRELPHPSTNLTRSSEGRNQRREAPSPGRRRRWTTSPLHRHWSATSSPPSLPTRWTVPAPPSPPMVGTSAPLSLMDLVVHVLGHVYPILVKSAPLDVHLMIL